MFFLSFRMIIPSLLFLCLTSKKKIGDKLKSQEDCVFERHAKHFWVSTVLIDLVSSCWTIIYVLPVVLKWSLLVCMVISSQKNVCSNSSSNCMFKMLLYILAVIYIFQNRIHKRQHSTKIWGSLLRNVLFYWSLFSGLLSFLHILQSVLHFTPKISKFKRSRYPAASP